MRTKYRYEQVDELTLGQVADLAKYWGAPESATIEYAGCGTHEVILAWREPMTAEEEAAVIAWERGIEEANERARDRRERRKGLPIIDDEKLGF